MKLSIITVNLNNRKGLIKTIESVVSQSFRDFEYIIIDGGSTDGSRGIMESYDTKISYWISEPDTGIYNAMNKGIRQAKGDYLLFLNSGDFLVGNDILKNVFEYDPEEDIVVGDCNVSDNGGFIFKAVPPEQITLSAFYGRTIPHQSAFIKRELFEKYGYYSEKYRLHSDLEFFIKTLILNNCSYRHLPVTVSDYNMEGLSSREESHSISIKENDDILNMLIPFRVISDYAFWEKEREEMKAYNWARTRPLLNKPLIWIFRFATFWVSLKKRIFNKK